MDILLQRCYRRGTGPVFVISTDQHSYGLLPQAQYPQKSPQNLAPSRLPASVASFATCYVKLYKAIATLVAARRGPEVL